MTPAVLLSKNLSNLITPAVLLLPSNEFRHSYLKFSVVLSPSPTWGVGCPLRKESLGWNEAHKLHRALSED